MTYTAQRYEFAWKNEGFGNRYTQYCYLDELESLEPKLARLIKMYGSAFDSVWQYWLTTKGKFKGRYVKRTSIFLQRNIDIESPRKQKGKQVKLCQ